jgi:hypothetical protein
LRIGVKSLGRQIDDPPKKRRGVEGHRPTGCRVREFKVVEHGVLRVGAESAKTTSLPVAGGCLDVDLVKARNQGCRLGGAVAGEDRNDEVICPRGESPGELVGWNDPVD